MNAAPSHVRPLTHHDLIYRLEDERYRRVAEYRDDDTLEHELFPGLSVPLGDLWLF